MFDKIILHVGLHKTGTTSLQNYFGNNRDKLKLQGISYPKLKVKEFTPNNHSWPIRNLIMSHPHKYHLNIANNILKNDLKEVINSIDKQFFKLGSTIESTLLLSGEGISTLKTKELSRLGEKLKCISTEKSMIEVHYFSRNPMDYISSVIQQRLKGGTTEDIILSGLSKVSPFRSFMNYGAFERAFNDVTIIEHCYEEACAFPGGLESYFSKVILNIDASKFSPNVSRDNSGLSDLSFQLIKYYLTHSQEYVRVPIEGGVYKRNIRALSKVKGGKFLITAEQKIKLLSLAGTKKLSDDWTVFFENKVLKSDLDCWNDVNVSQVVSCINQADAECHTVLIQLFNEVLLNGKGDGEKVRLLLKSLTKKNKPDSYLIKLKRKSTQIARKWITYFQ